GSSALMALHGLAAAALVTLIPGLCWSAFFRPRGAGRIALVLGLSTLVLLAVLLGLRATGHAPRPALVAFGLMLIAGAPLPFLRGRGRIALPLPAVIMAAVAAITLAFFALGVVPPIEDQDMEMQATAHAMALRQEPAALTNRSTAYYFAHPPLL